MNQIERYIFGRIAKLTIWSIVAITLLSLTTQILIRVDILTTSSNALMTFAKLAVTLVPKVFLVVAPFALLVGVGRVLVHMNDDSELVVVEAAGASSLSLAKPVLFFSMLVGFFMLFTANILSPRAEMALRSTIAEAKADILSIAVSSGSFRKIEDGLYIQVAQSLPGGAMGGIFLSDQRDDNVELIYYAKAGTIENSSSGNLLLMQDGEIHRSESDDKQVSIVKFQSYGLDLSLFIPASSQGAKRPEELYLKELLFPDVNSDSYKQSHQFYALEVHTRLISWLYPITFGIVMVAFLARARSHRNENLDQILAALMICLLVRIAGGSLLEQSKTQVWALYAAYGAPIGTSIFFMIFVLTGRTVRMPKIWSWLLDQLQRVSHRKADAGHPMVRSAGTAKP